MNAIADAGRTLFRAWKKYLLTVLGIAIGVASVVVVRGLGNYGAQEVLSELNELGMGGILISLEDNEGNSVLDEEVLQFLQARSEIADAMPLATQYAKGMVGEFTESLLLMGVNASVDRIISLKMSAGTTFAPEAVKTGEKDCLIDQNTAQLLYGTEQAVGKMISLVWNGVQEEFRVVGISEYGSGLLQNTVGEYIPPIAYIPYTTLSELTGRETFPQIALRLSDSTDSEQFLGQITQIFRDLKPEAQCTVRNLAQQAGQLDQLLNLIVTLLTSVAAISLAVACIGIMTNMLISVRERQKEIGIRKAIGARKGDIVSEFLWESVLLSVVGCLVGNAIGFGALMTARIVGNFSIPLEPKIIGITLLVSTGTGVLFGVLPAMRAGAIRPIDSIRRD